MFLPKCERPSFTPIKITRKIIVLYILIIIFLDTKLEDKTFCTRRQSARCFFWMKFWFVRIFPSLTMGTGSFPGVKSGRGVTLTPHPLLVLWSRKGRAIPLLPLWAVRLYRPSVPVQGCNLSSLVDLLHRNSHWRSPIISSAYGVSLDSRMLDIILYVDDKTNMPL
jgi:hypothetical protein